MSIHSGHSHSFDVGIAKSIGVNAAIIFNHIVYWLRVNAAKSHNVIEGKVWMYEKQQEIADFLEYLSIDEVKKAMVKLIDSGLLIKDNFNDNPFDKTGWYTTSDQSIIFNKKSLTKVPNGTIGSATRHDPRSPAAPSTYQEDKQKDNDVCIAEANGPVHKSENEPDEPQKIRRIHKKNGRGKDISIGWDELMSYAVNEKKDWRMTEMREAWQILHHREGFMNDPLEFIGGIITNLRTKIRAAAANRGTSTCKSQTMNKANNEMKSSPDTSKISKPNSAEKGTGLSILDVLASLQNKSPLSQNG